MQSQVFYFVVYVHDGVLAVPMKRSEGTAQVTLPALSPNPHDFEQPIISSWESDTNVLVDFARQYLFLDLYIADCILKYNKSGVLVTFLLADMKNVQVPKMYQVVEFNRMLHEHWLIAHEDMVSISNSLQKRISTLGNLHDIAVPWRHLMWIRSTETWMRAVLIGSSKTDLYVEELNLKQITNTGFSTVLKCEKTSKGPSSSSLKSINTNVNPVNYYVKCTHSAFAEATLTEGIQLYLPEFIPPILSHKKSCMFIQEGGVNSFITDNEILVLLYDMQMASISHVHNLKKHGIPLHDVNWHINEVKQLTQLNQSEDADINDEDLSKLVSFLKELSSFKLPNVVVHGDFHRNNAVRKPGSTEPQLIDWETVHIGHPFVDYLRITEYEMDLVEDEDSKTTYCEKWHRYESPSVVKRAMYLAPLLVYLRYMYIAKTRFNKVDSPCNATYLETFMNSRSALLSELKQMN